MAIEENILLDRFKVKFHFEDEKEKIIKIALAFFLYVFVYLYFFSSTKYSSKNDFVDFYKTKTTKQ